MQINILNEMQPIFDTSEKPPKSKAFTILLVIFIPVTIQRHRNPQTVIHRRTCHSPMTEPQMIDVEVDELLAVDVLQPHGHVAQHALQLAFAEFLPANSV